MAPQIESSSTEKVESDNSIKFGKILANPAPGEEVVITGLSGHYPESKNVYEFRDNLFNKRDMVSGDSRRWKPGHPEIPQRTGKIPDIEEFDAGYFGAHYREATQMDPMCRVFLEVATEAIFDAGLNPSDLEGTNTGVFIGCCFSETEKTWFTDKLIPQGFAIIGNERSMIAHRASYCLKLKGPSFICDTACSSSLYALENAYKALRMGACDRAIVGGANLCLHPFVSLQFARLGVLSPDGACKAFDISGNGYARSETVSAILLQKSKEAKRIYATILHAKTNCDGYKNSGITYPSGEMQVRLLKEFYQECDYVKPTELSFLEAHGTGTKVGDPEELQAVEEVFTIGRSTPLLIGSVKSNIGHTEPSSGLCSITKVIIASETGYIPPNINYKTPRPGIKGLEDGRLKVVTDKTPFVDNRGLLGINSFGFGGGNCHVLLKQNTKEKRNNGKATDNIPRLVCVSGRTKKAIDTLLDDVIANNVDVEQVRLLHEIFGKDVAGHLFRGFSLVSKSGEILRSSNTSKKFTASLTICFGSIDIQTIENSREFLELPTAATTLQSIHEVIGPKGHSIRNILSISKYTTVLDMVMANFTLQAVLADMIKACNIVPDKIFGVTKGFSLGSLVCGYFDDALTLQEAANCAYHIASAAHSVSCSNCIDTTELSVLIDQSGTIATRLQQILTGILKKPRRLSKKVIFDGSPSEISSVYLTNCFGQNKILLDVKKVFKKNWAFFEIGNGEVGQELSKGIIGNNQDEFIKCDGGIDTVLSSIGRLYQIGFNPQIQNIYPKVDLPVSRGTPMISPHIKWNHDRQWWVTSYKTELVECEEKTTSLLANDPGFAFMKGHVIDGRNLIPATGYLQLVWECLAHIHGLMISDMKIIFEDCQFKRATPLPKEGTRLELIAMIQRGSGNFEVIEGGVPVVTGRVYHIPGDKIILDDFPLPCAVNKDKAPYLSRKDVYKELRLRGYNYSGQFRGIQSCDSGTNVANILWDCNWVTFMDNMLQMKILQEDSRLLYVPTSIQRLAIDAKRHIEYAKGIGEENPVLPAYASRDTGIIRSGGIEIRGLHASSIAKRKYLGTPVIEKYQFIPNSTCLTKEQAIRANVQILLENIPTIKVKVVELVDEATPTDKEPLAEVIYDVLGDQPLIQPDITILSKTELEVNNVKVEDKKLLTEVDCSLVVGSAILQRPNILQLTLGSIKENGFILSRESLSFDSATYISKEINIITIFKTEDEKLVLFRKKNIASIVSTIKISADDEEFTWIRQLQNAKTKNGNIILYSQGEELNGILGLASCLRREPGGLNIRAVFIADAAPAFDINLPFYSDQLDKNLAISVYKEGLWGTYRHLQLEQVAPNEAEHCYLNSLRRGDLSSLTWLEGPLNISKNLNPEQTLVHVHYSSINFRDIMTAIGRINADSITRERIEQECVQGFEFSGITDSGERVMGMVINGACASLVAADRILIWRVPNNWTLQEAVTVPVVYSTTFIGLVQVGRMKRGNSILIHSGTGGVGLAAIQVALHLGCTVYTTVGTPEKRVFLKERFPQLKDHHISNSRTTEFEQHIMKATNGRGVDIVLNSLAEEKLVASLRCLVQGGRFIEIGKFDLASNNKLNLLLLSKFASFHGIMVDAFISESTSRKVQMHDALQELLDAGAIRPLPKTVFKMNEAEAAFRHMTTGKHMGKVMIEIRKEQINKSNLSPKKFLCMPRYHCDPSKIYVICGGLGGFGLELADWLVLRGCRNLVLTSRTGIKTGYQSYRISIWRSYGCTVQVATDDITTYEGCQDLIRTSNELGPVHAIFNLAVVLKDAIFENQSEESFKISFGPKARATQYLDIITRELCPLLRDFVVFSSVSCGRGNPGQSNYGMSNSVMERICEKRRKEGFPALAIEWGAVGDVGLVADMQEEAIDMEIGGTLQQRISNCLEVMDSLLKQTDSAIVSSMVVAEKKSRIGRGDNIVDAVAIILGIKDLKSISLQATLAEVGMDSMTAVEIKQTLEREYDVFLTPQDIKGMTFARLIDIQTERDAEKQSGVKKERALAGMDMIMRMVPDEVTSNTLIMPAEGKPVPGGSSSTVILFPGIEGLIRVVEPLYKNILANLLGLQFPNNKQKDTIEEMAEIYVPIVEERLSKGVPFKIVSYSFGCVVALEVAKLLEEKGYRGTIICIDGAPNYLKALTKLIEVESDEKFQVSLIVHLVTLQHPYEVIAKHVEALLKCNSFEERMKLAQSVVPSSSLQTPEHQRQCTLCLYKRLRAFVKWTPDFKLKSKIVLFKPNMVSIETPDEISGLADLSEMSVDVQFFDGNHLSVLDNPELAEAVNESLGLKELQTVKNKC